jgi:hypothetical protein
VTSRRRAIGNVLSGVADPVTLVPLAADPLMWVPTSKRKAERNEAEKPLMFGDGSERMITGGLDRSVAALER